VLAWRLLRGYAGNRAATDLASGARVTVESSGTYKSYVGMALDTINYAHRLHLVYRQGASHVNPGVDFGVVKYRTSDDYGATWSASTTIISAASIDLRDPNIACLSTGRLVVGYDYSPESTYWCQPRVIYSDDGGATWSSPYTVVSSGMTYECAVTSQMVELADGTVLLPAFGINALSDTYYFAVLFKSSDHGATWGGQTTIASSGSYSYGEPQFRYVSAGQLVCFMDSSTDAQIWRSVSTDGGATWSAPQSVLVAGGRSDWVEYWPNAYAMWCRAAPLPSSDARWTVSFDSGLTWAALRDTDGPTDLYEYGAPVVVGISVIIVYSLEASSSEADLYCRTYSPS